MSRPIFFDSDALPYSLAEDAPRGAVAARLLAAGGVVSVQAFDEFTNVARRKLRLSWPEVRRALAGIRTLCPPPLPIAAAAHDAALGIAERPGYQVCDSLIVASALEAGCATLYSEACRTGRWSKAR